MHSHGDFVPHTHLPIEPLLSLRQVLVGYGGQAILPPISFDLRTNELWAIIGRNGSGKTTLLRTILGLLPRVGGQIVRRQGMRIGYVPQRNEVDYTVPARVIDAVRGGIDHGWSFATPWTGAAAHRRVERSMEETGVTRLARAQLSELSEGQKQRVLLARALVTDPHLLILDEPTSAMDLVAERAVFELIDQLRREHHLGVLVVTHHLALVAERATDVLFVDKEDHVALAGCIQDIAASNAFISRYGTMECGDLSSTSRNLSLPPLETPR